MAGGLAAVLWVAAVFLALMWAVCAESATAAKDTVRAMHGYRMM
jgi:hypothetical protein